MHACLELTVMRNQAFQCNSDSDVRGCRIRSDEAMSLLYSTISMFLVRRKVILEERRGGVGFKFEVSENSTMIRYSDKRL